MKQYSRLIILVGGVIALFSFALPWSEDGSGVEMANEKLVLNAYVLFVRAMLIAALFIIITSLFFKRKLKEKISNSIVYWSSIVGLICFFVLFFGESLDLEFYETKYGVFICAVGFIVAVVGVWDLSKKDKKTMLTEEEEN